MSNTTHTFLHYNIYSIPESDVIKGALNAHYNTTIFDRDDLEYFADPYVVESLARIGLLDVILPEGYEILTGLTEEQCLTCTRFCRIDDDAGEGYSYWEEREGHSDAEAMLENLLYCMGV